jgi:peptidoglycan-associated lipoprotein
MANSSNRTSLFLALALVVFAGLFLGGCRKYPNCKTDAHCERWDDRDDTGRPFCVDNICRECRDDSACDEGYQCSGGSCSRIAGYCSENIPCPPPQVCRDNRCGPQCLSDSDCPGTFGYCQNGLCMEGECNGDSDCQEGFRCEGRMCRPIPQALAPCHDGTFKTIYFDFDQSALTAQGRTDMEWNMACINNDSRNVTIEGHCDERGTEEYNIALGDRRARAVRDFFTGAGIARARINTVSYGETRPADPRSNEAAWRQNRRAVTTWR